MKALKTSDKMANAKDKLRSPNKATLKYSPKNKSTITSKKVARPVRKSVYKPMRDKKQDQLNHGENYLCAKSKSVERIIECVAKATRSKKSHVTIENNNNKDELNALVLGTNPDCHLDSNKRRKKCSEEKVPTNYAYNNTPCELKTLPDAKQKVEEASKKKRVPVYYEISGKNSHKKKGDAKCMQCSRYFANKVELQKHSFTHTEFKSYSCMHCEMRFRQGGNMKTHILRRHSDIMTTEKVYVCDVCKRVFLFKDALRLHINSHFVEKRFACSICHRPFKRIGQVVQHAKRHTGERVLHHCGTCQMVFTTAGKLKLHMRGQHLGIKDHTCHICGKSFLRSDSIKKHLDCSHFEVKHFECPVCKKKLKGHLREHMRTHGNTKRFTCTQCPSQFAQKSQLTVHLRKHTGVRPYACRICPRAFTHSSALSLHVRRHTGERPVQCPLCPASFSQLPHMKTHMIKIHNSHTPYKCPSCGSFFRSKQDITQHTAGCLHAIKVQPQGLEEVLLARFSEASKEVDPAMPLTRMRLLLAILLRKIAKDTRLKELGFNKRLVDDILVDCLESTGHTPLKDESVSESERLKQNINMLMEWTVPAQFMEKFRSENRSTEELLQVLTS